MTSTLPQIESAGAGVGDTPAPRAERLVVVLTKATIDEVYPAFILANTAAASGMQVDVYFTFWGMTLLDKRKVGKVKLSPVGNPAMGMPDFLAVLPGMTTMATWMMKRKIKQYWPTIPEMMEQARDLGVRMHACSPTMGLMGLTAEHLVPDCDIVGASTFLDWASSNAVTIFI